jgi:hypothetical protein
VALAAGWPHTVTGSDSRGPAAGAGPMAKKMFVLNKQHPPSSFFLFSQNCCVYEMLDLQYDKLHFVQENAGSSSDEFSSCEPVP